jgi:hypothetical protein
MVVAGAGLFAQQAAPQQTPTLKPLPPGPIPTAAPDHSQWLISFKDSAPSLFQEQPKEPVAKPNPAEGGSNAPTPANSDWQMLVTKTGSIIHEQEAGNTMQDRWYLPSMTITVPSGAAPQVSMSVRGSGAQVDFPDFSWITRKDYTADMSILGRNCFIFSGNKNNKDHTATPARAAIDEKTCLPVALEYDGHVVTYEFRPPPSGQLTLPPALQKLTNSLQEAIQRSSALPARP